MRGVRVNPAEIYGDHVEYGCLGKRVLSSQSAEVLYKNLWLVWKFRCCAVL